MNCPQCGRSLRVPSRKRLSGRAKSSAPEEERDFALMSALSELSVLGDEPSAKLPRPGRVEEPVVTSVPETHVIDLPVVLSRESHPSGSEPDGSKAGTTAECLSELAALEPGEVSSLLLDDMRTVSQSRRDIVPTWIRALLLVALGGGLGFLLAFAFRRGSGSIDPDIPVPAKDDVVVAGAVADLGGAEFHGAVTYETDAGKEFPDAGATVIVLPEQRVGTLKLNSRSLKNDAPEFDQLATIAALKAFGGTIVGTNADGHFLLPIASSEGALVLIVVSRNHQRPSDVPVASDVVDVLESWFDSVPHICGQRSVRKIVVDAGSQPIEVRFHAAAQ